MGDVIRRTATEARATGLPRPGRVPVPRLCRRSGVGVLLVAGLLLVGGCTPSSTPAPPELFGEFTVTQTGGVAGLYNPLLVRPDGVAIVMSNHPVAGSIVAGDMDRLRTLLTSQQFREEAAADAGPDESQLCADALVWTVTMGSLSVVDGDGCGGDRGAQPATDEVIAVLAEEVGGQFTIGVPAGNPRLVSATLDRQATQYYPAARLTSTPTGMVTMQHPEGATRTRRLPPADRDTLRLLLDRQAARPANQCQHPGPYRLRVGGPRPVTVTYCVGAASPRELLATIALLENPFGR